jgi:hypothetical protein
MMNKYINLHGDTPFCGIDDTKKGANSSGLQVQSVVERINFLHEGTQGLISNSWGTVEKAHRSSSRNL